MVSTRSRSTLHSGEGADRADAGQAEVSSAAKAQPPEATPRRSSRLARSSSGSETPSGRTRQARAASKKLEAQLEAIAEEGAAAAAPAAAAEGGRRDVDAAQPAEQQQQQQPASPQAGGAEEPEGEDDSVPAAAPSAHTALPLLAADSSLLDKVASEMFAALEEEFGDSSSEEEEGGDSGSEDESQREQHAQRGGGIIAEAAAAGQDATGDAVPRHLRWEPELQLPGMAEAGGRAQQQQQHRPQRAQQKQKREPPLAKQLHAAPRDERALQRSRRGAAPDTAGKQWFDLPATTVTDEVKRDLRMLRLRTAFDPKAFYKKLDSSKFPKHFHMGTVVEGAADFYSGRLTKSERKRTFTEEVMSDPHLAEVRKKRFTKLQEERSYWANKKAARKTENERLKKKPRKPKH